MDVILRKQAGLQMARPYRSLWGMLPPDDVQF